MRRRTLKTGGPYYPVPEYAALYDAAMVATISALIRNLGTRPSEAQAAQIAKDAIMIADAVITELEA